MTFERDTMRFKLFIHEILVKLGRCPVFEDSRFWIEGGGGDLSGYFSKFNYDGLNILDLEKVEVFSTQLQCCFGFRQNPFLNFKY